ncbi:helix-turn-helix domain-containing protein [Phenylobacterium sp.]|uniref:helix-turn-helix domain-containing protein n=1 Tax=Phenylobacterium sp. TaxID=1871053 RepID=UPI00345904EC
MTDNLPRLFTEEEAAAYLRLNPRTLARLRQAGEIRHIKIAARRYRYLEEHLIAFLAARGAGPKSEEPPLHGPISPSKSRKRVLPDSRVPFFPKPRRRDPRRD